MRYLIDTSAWVEFFRASESPADRAVTELVRDPRHQVIGCPPVRFELGLDHNELRRHRVLRVFDGFAGSGMAGEDFDIAAQVHRATRASGHPPRSINDCLIAAIALRRSLTLVHRDVDFDRMAEVLQELSVLRLPVD